MILKKIILFAFLFQFTNLCFGCCAESSYHLLPLGEINNEIVFLELKMYRNCKHNPNFKKTEMGNEIFMSAIINLVKFTNDSIVLIHTIDSVSTTECICTYKDYYYKTNFETIIEDYYLNALSQLKNKAEPVSIAINDTINTTLDETDSSYNLIYKDLLNFDLYSLPISSCVPDKVIENRVYETKNYYLTIVRLSCSLTSDKAKKRNTKRFKSIETAFWKEQLIWHGTLIDYAFLTPK